MAAAALAGALATTIAFSGDGGPPAPELGDEGAGGSGDGAGGAGTGSGGLGTGTGGGTPDVPMPAVTGSGEGVGPAAAGGGGGGGDGRQPDMPLAPPPPPPPVRTDDARAAPAPGAKAPPGALTFYTRGDLVEFVEGGGAHSPVAVLAARFPVGGSVVNIMTGGLAEMNSSLGAQLSGGLAPGDALAAPGGAPVPGGAATPPDPAALPAGLGGGGGGSADMASPPVESPAAAPAAPEGFSMDGSAAPAEEAPAPAPSPDHSATNVQVEGVDEPDFVKNDERHIYILDGPDLTIIDALPADTVKVLSGNSAGEVRDSYRPEDASIVFRGRIGAADDRRYDNMFLDGDSLIVIHGARQWASVPLDPGDPTRTVAAPLPYTYVLWVDIGDRSAPVTAGEYAVDGEYRAARMIDGTVYLVTRAALQEPGLPGLPGLRYSGLDGGEPGLPCHGPAAGGGCGGGRLVPPAYYVAPVEDDPYLTTVSALPPGGAAPSAQTYLLGDNDIAYVSRGAAYLALPRVTPGAAEVLDGLRDTGLLRAMVEPIGAQWRQEALSAAARAGMPADDRLEAVLSAVQSGYDGLAPAKRAAALGSLEETAWSWHYAVVQADPRTDVHRIEIGGARGGAPALSYAAAGAARGEPLDQFSMDEHGGAFRIATIVQDGRNPPHTAVSVLDVHSMGRIASLEGIAPGETMRSARFAGDTLFLVTFRQVDPFFVVDMSGAVPVILGELKVEGFSSYLQPYGPDTVVGVGTYLSENLDDPARDGAVKVSLYDVSDYRRPALAGEAVIGGGGTWSPAQSNHRALLADEGRGIIALPVVSDWGQPRLGAESVFEACVREWGWEQCHPRPPLADEVAYDAGWTGFYVFRTDADGGADAAEGGTAGLGEPHTIHHGVASDGVPPEGRSLYIADWLYTIYDGVLVVSDLDDPGRRVASIDLGR